MKTDSLIGKDIQIQTYDPDGELLHPASCFPNIRGTIITSTGGLDDTRWYLVRLHEILSLDGEAFEFSGEMATKKASYIFIAPMRFRPFFGRDILAEYLLKGVMFKDAVLFYVEHPRNIPPHVTDDNVDSFPALTSARILLADKAR
jgi:hypothetical protein